MGYEHVAVTGPGGQLGSQLVALGCQPMEANITDAWAVSRDLEDLKPEVIINTAAWTDVDGAETADESVWLCNVEGPRVLRENHPGLLVQISTDFVFDGQKGPYGELATPSPLQIYGLTKLGSELVVRGDRPWLIVRTTLLFHEHTANTVTWAAQELLEGRNISLSARHMTSPTYTTDLAVGILEAIDRGLTGYLNLAGDLVMSRYGLGCRIANALGISRERVLSLEDRRGGALRPVRGGLLVEQAKRVGLTISDTNRRLQEVCDAMA